LTRRSYNRFDPLAVALEQVGDRWTLIIVRALMNKPQRYSDLRVFVSGSGSNLLADRLRRLADLGILTRSAGSRAGSDVTYQLTERGWALAPVIESLVRFGVRALLSAPPENEAGLQQQVFDQGWAMTNPDLVVSESYEWTVDGKVFTLEVVVEGLQIVRTSGPAKAPAVKLETSTEVLERILAGKTTLGEAADSKRLTLNGRPSAVERMFTAIGFPPEQISTLQGAETG
jgi:DNA-binding HxlR family transcriptional regulator